jgi:hypothetical protein
METVDAEQNGPRGPQQPQGLNPESDLESDLVFDLLKRFCFPITHCTLPEGRHLFTVMSNGDSKLFKK